MIAQEHFPVEAVREHWESYLEQHHYEGAVFDPDLGHLSPNPNVPDFTVWMYYGYGVVISTHYVLDALAATRIDPFKVDE